MHYFTWVGAICLFSMATISNAEKAMPVAVSGGYTLSTGPFVLSVGTADGGRVFSLKHQNKEMLFTKVAGSLLWGSTLWPSPQVNWTAACKSAKNQSCFPPPTALDPNSYSATLLTQDTAITLTGSGDSYTKLRFRKTFWANLNDTSFSAHYHLINTSSAAISWGPWETTRFPSGGLIFWPTGQGQKTGDASMIQRMRDSLGVTWFPYDSSKSISSNPKIFADGGAGGWLARVDKDRVLFIKKFMDTPPAKAAPEGENEIELYIQRELLELELQGPYGPIAANDSVSWDVKWFVRKLPDSISISSNAALVAFVEKTVGDRPTSIRNRPHQQMSKEYPNPEHGQIQSESFQASLKGRRLELVLSEPRNLRIQLSDANGREIYQVSPSHFTSGKHFIELQQREMRASMWIRIFDEGNQLKLKQLAIGNPQ